MTKARFVDKQDAVRVTTLDDENYFAIALNEAQIDVPMETETGTTQTVTMYEYDYNEWHDHTTDVDAVRAEPSKWLNYAPSVVPTEHTPTIGERISTLEDKQAATAAALQDLMLG